MKGRGGPVTRSTTWRTQARVPEGDRSTHEHMVLSETLELTVCYDQLNLGALASAELMVRRLQLIEAAHQHNPGNPDYTGARHFMGETGMHQGALIAPELTSHVSDRLQAEAKIMKECRVAKEEQALRYPRKGKNNKKDDDDE